MSNTNTPYVAKSAASLVNPTSATVFIPYLPNPIQAASAYSAYTAYNVFNNSVSTTTQAVVASSAHGENVNCAMFLVRAYGRCTGGTATNFTPTLLFGRSPTYASNTVMGSLTASAFNTASGVWALEAKLLWDVTSGNISGSLSGYNGSTAAIIAAALVTPVTGQSASVLAGNTQPNALFFSIAGLFSASNASNVAFLDTFEVEDL